MTDELKQKGASEIWIEQFCSTGPKSYSYRTNLYKTRNDDGVEIEKQNKVVHVKGFLLKGEAKKRITFESILSCVENQNKIIEITYKENISRDYMQNIVVQDHTKKFKFTFDERVVLPNFLTVAYRDKE